MDLQRIRVGVDYNGQQVINKLRRSPVLGTAGVAYERALNKLETTIKKEVTGIYDASFRSAVPIRAAYTPGSGFFKLTIGQKQRITNALGAGRSIEDIIDTIVKSPGDPYGGTLRRSIRNNIGSIRRNTDGIVSVPNTPHSAPYKREYNVSNEALALSLNINDTWRRSRPSEAVAGFPSISGPTHNWINIGRIQAQPFIQTYLNSTAATFSELVRSEQVQATSNIGRYVNQTYSPSLGVRQEQFNKSLGEAVKAFAEGTRTATNKDLDSYGDQGTSADDLFGVG